MGIVDLETIPPGIAPADNSENHNKDDISTDKAANNLPLKRKNHPMVLKRNMHPIDQVLRVILGVALIYIGIFNKDLVSDALLGYLLAGFGVVNVVSGLLAICPVYAVAGISTLRKVSNTR